MLELYWTFFKLGCVSFGGGYSMIPLIEREVVEEKKWVDKDNIVDIFAVSESLPGAIALNSSAFVGYSVAGIRGSLSALVGNMTPSVIIVLTLSVLFQQISSNPLAQAAFRGIYPAIVGLIAYAAYKIGKLALRDKVCVAIMILSFIAAMFFHLEPVKIIIAGALSGVAITYSRMHIAIKRENFVSNKEGAVK